MGGVRIWAMINGVIVMLLVGGALFGEDGVVRHERIGERLQRTEALNEEFRRENERLEVEAHALRHDPAYVEHVIRDELGFVREGEIIFLFPEPEPRAE